MPVDLQFVKAEVKKWTIWWIRQRKSKLEKELTETMSVNPFLLPFLFEYHSLKNFDELIHLMVASHLMTGHNTGFGKLIDEKILPSVFKTIKLDRKFRQANPPFENSSFNEIDHMIVRPDGSKELISLKAGKWTIQLTMAVKLNESFNEIKRYYGASIKHIIVGVFYGTDEDLTDKYDILRGINRGAKHHVVEITDFVSVYTGKKFWEWLGGGAVGVQDAILLGFIEAIRELDVKSGNEKLLLDFRKKISSRYDNSAENKGVQDWIKLLNSINK